jgi:hypothetical protein
MLDAASAAAATHHYAAAAAAALAAGVALRQLSVLKFQNMKMKQTVNWFRKSLNP